MPQRETVAGEATERSIGSKIRFMRSLMAMISPLTRQSFLLSSSTVFMFSIQMASTGPSKIIQKRCAAVSCAQLRNMVARMPSVSHLVELAVEATDGHRLGVEHGGDHLHLVGVAALGHARERAGEDAVRARLGRVGHADDHEAVPH
eukprot:scaffold68002_cov50-Phaeocystis_antarctica.AAC.1